MQENNNRHSTLVECPYCKRKLNSEKTNGEPRKIIHYRGTVHCISDENTNLRKIIDK